MPIGERWLNNLVERLHCDVAAVALANRNARIAWAPLVFDDNLSSRCRLHEPEKNIELLVSS
jgi:hypothetical protein